MKNTSRAKTSFQINWSRMLEKKFDVDDLKVVECGNLLKQIFLMINFTWTRLSSYFLHMLYFLSQMSLVRNRIQVNRARIKYRYIIRYVYVDKLSTNINVAIFFAIYRF